MSPLVARGTQLGELFACFRIPLPVRFVGWKLSSEPEANVRFRVSLLFREMLEDRFDDVVDSALPVARFGLLREGGKLVSGRL